MRSRVPSLSDRFLDFLTGIVNWMWDTCDLVFDIFLDFLTRAVELAIALLQLSFQVICFLRDLCIEAMQTFVNVFRGFVNVVSAIKCEDVEDFAAACMVVGLWFAAVKLVLSILEKRQKPLPNPFRLFGLCNDCLAAPRDSRSILKGAAKKKVTIQGRKRAARKRPAKASISSSSSASCNACD